MAATRDRLSEVLAALEAAAEPKVLADLAPSYGITAAKAMGVAMNRIQAIAKPYAGDHDLAQALWDTGWYERARPPA